MLKRLVRVVATAVLGAAIPLTSASPAPIPSAAALSVTSTPGGARGQGESLDTDTGLALAPSEARLSAMRAARDASQKAGPKARSTAPTRQTDGTYLLGPDRPVAVPRAQLPYTRNSPLPLDGNQPRDGSGVPVYIIQGRVFQHPVRQASDGINMLESYKVTGNAAYLTRAEADAARLISSRVVSRNAWFYPYQFDFALHGNTSDVIDAPWYSAMAQGMSLSLFTQLHQQTGKAAYREAADRTMASLTLGPSGTLPFVTWVDTSGHLFLEEYAQLPLSRSDRTLNGHLFAVFGVYEYYQMSESPIASQVFSGALKMVRDYYPTQYRNPGWISSYCLTHPQITDPDYHSIHVNQFKTMQGLTGQNSWSDWSDQLFEDYPEPKVNTEIWLAAGSQTGYTFDVYGRVTSTRLEQYSSVTRATVDRRVRIQGRGIFYRVTSGPWAGWYLPESSGRAYAHVMFGVRTHPRLRPATLPAREILVRTFDNAGNTTSLKRITPRAPTAVRYQQVTVINGESWVRPVDGPAPYYWTRAADLGVGGQAAYVAPRVTSVTVAPDASTRFSTATPVGLTATVVIDDPADVVRRLDVTAGYSLQGASVARLATQRTLDVAPGPARKAFAVKLISPYRLPGGPTTPYGNIQVLALTSNPARPSVFAGAAVLTSLKGTTVGAISPSVATTRPGNTFTVSGSLRFFDTSALTNRPVIIYYVPAGSTRRSYAGTATTTSMGTFSLPVRAWFTGSWFVQYAGNAAEQPSYKGTWVRVD